MDVGLLTMRDSIIVFIVALCAGWLAVAVWAWRHPAHLHGLEPRPLDHRIAINDEHDTDAAMLELLPGVGPSIARNIVESRDQHGPFRDADDLQRVHFIGPGIAQRVEPWIDFEAEIE